MTTLDSSTQHTAEKVVLEDRPCSSCGYNLKGLVTGGKCPECGTLIRAFSRLHEDDLGDAPKAYLRVLQLGFVVLGFAGVMIMLAVLSLLIDSALATRGAIMQSVTIGPSGAGGAFRAVAFPLGAIAWSVGMQFVLHPRPGVGGQPRQRDGKTEWSTLRAFVRTGSIALALGVIANVVAGLASIEVLRYISLPLIVYGIAGVVALCFYLSNIAHWASDTHIAMRLIHTGIVFGISGVLASLFFTPLLLAIGIFIFPVFMCLLGSGVYLLVLVFKMSTMITWAQKNARHRAERDARMAERARQQAEEAARRSGFVGAPSEADPHLLATVERQNAAMEAERARQDAERRDTEGEDSDDRRPYRGHTLDASGADAYTLEDD
ncbi:MAG: hypothetical protein Tsb0013_17140 [Phycisphaerales bacterium]